MDGTINTLYLQYAVYTDLLIVNTHCLLTSFFDWHSIQYVKQTRAYNSGVATHLYSLDCSSFKLNDWCCINVTLHKCSYCQLLPRCSPINQTISWECIQCFGIIGVIMLLTQQVQELESYILRVELSGGSSRSSTSSVQSSTSRSSRKRHYSELEVSSCYHTCVIFVSKILYIYTIAIISPSE